MVDELGKHLDAVTHHTCKNCTYWTGRTSYEHGSPGGLEFGQCAMAATSYGEPLEPSSIAYANDLESYSATLRTREDFGCNQFKMK